MPETPYRFSQRVDNYIKHRPRYPGTVLELLKADCQLTSAQVIADIGSGTGILSELFLRNSNPVFGVEPDPVMRAGAEYYLRNFPNFTSVAASAESTTLTDHSVDFVTAGQAFHWFNLEEARREFGRILLPGGWIVLVWNIQRPSGTPFLDALQRFWKTRRFWKPFPEGQSEKVERAQAYRLNPELARQELFEPFFGTGVFKEKLFENPMVCDFERLKGRVLSNQPALEPGDTHYEDMLAALEKIFRKHQTEGRVTIEHITWVVYGKLPAHRI